MSHTNWAVTWKLRLPRWQNIGLEDRHTIETSFWTACGIIVLCGLIVRGTADAGEGDVPVDAMVPEHVRVAITDLDDSTFSIREDGTERLSQFGTDGVFALENTAANGSVEASIRAFEILSRLYRTDDESTFVAVEHAFRRLIRAERVAVSTRAERAFDSLIDLRQVRSVDRFLKLGGIIHFKDANPDRHVIGASQIEVIVIGRDWKGTDDDVRLIESIQGIQMMPLNLVIVRGVAISDETLFGLKATLPLLIIQPRGPARLGVTNHNNGGGCVIDRVEPGSSADNAGLKTNDLIIEIDGEVINNFESLVNVIEKKEVHDRVPIVFIRDGVIHEVEAELLPWSHRSRPAQPLKP